MVAPVRCDGISTRLRTHLTGTCVRAGHGKLAKYLNGTDTHENHDPDAQVPLCLPTHPPAHPLCISNIVVCSCSLRLRSSAIAIRTA